MYWNLCNEFSAIMSVPKGTKDINVKAFNMITNKDEDKTMTKTNLCDWKCKFSSTKCNSNQKRINKTCK